MLHCVWVCVCAVERSTLSFSSRQKNRKWQATPRTKTTTPRKKKTTTCNFYRLHKNGLDLTELNGQSRIIIDIPATLNLTASSSSSSIIRVLLSMPAADSAAMTATLMKKLMTINVITQKNITLGLMPADTENFWSPRGGFEKLWCTQRQQQANDTILSKLKHWKLGHNSQQKVPKDCCKS